MNCDQLDTGIASAEQNMNIDRRLMQRLSDQKDLLFHFYEWDSLSATYGYFIDPKHYLNEQGVHKRGLQLARRPTGGGIVLHIGDFAFSLLIPSSHAAYSMNTIENYATINKFVADAINQCSGNKLDIQLLQQELHDQPAICSNFCMAKPSMYDLMVAGKKIGGGAQRRSRHGILHQGTISLTMPDAEYLNDILGNENAVLMAMQMQTFPLIDRGVLPKDISETKQILKKTLVKTVKNSNDLR